MGRALTWCGALTSSSLLLEIDMVFASVLEVEGEDSTALLDSSLLDLRVFETGVELLEEFLCA